MTQPEGFSQMILDANAFFAKLSQNNTREWFEPRKEHFVAGIRKPAELFAGIMAEEISRETGIGHVPKVYRIYRDVRFSKDKTPYNAHLPIQWTPNDADRLAPGYFFASSPERFELFSGIPGMKGDDLTRYRAFVDKWGSLLDDVIKQTGAHFSDFGAPPLKRVPSPYEKDHPHGDLLKRKSLILGVKMDDDPGRELVARVMGSVRRLRPFQKLMLDKL